MIKTFKSIIIGDGSEKDSRRPEVSNYGINWSLREDLGDYMIIQIDAEDFTFIDKLTDTVEV